MFHQLLESLKTYEKEFENWQPHHFLEAKSETLKKAVERSLQAEPTFEHFLQNGTVEEATQLLELLREEVPMMTVGTLKGILDALYRHEALQGKPSQDLVGWYRKQGWKFPPFQFEKEQEAAQKIETQPAASGEAQQSPLPSSPTLPLLENEQP